MKNDSIKKYLIPNIPYLFVLWAFLKLGTAYRLAAGADFAHKLMGLGQTIGPAFADFAPGLAPFDWLVGIVGAVAFRVMVYVKSKNAKKFRRDGVRNFFQFVSHRPLPGTPQPPQCQRASQREQAPGQSRQRPGQWSGPAP